MIGVVKIKCLINVTPKLENVGLSHTMKVNLMIVMPFNNNALEFGIR